MFNFWLQSRWGSVLNRICFWIHSHACRFRQKYNEWLSFVLKWTPLNACKTTILFLFNIYLSFYPRNTMEAIAWIQMTLWAVFAVLFPPPLTVHLHMNGPLVLNGKEIRVNYIHFSDTVSNSIWEKIPHPFKRREPFQSGSFSSWTFPLRFLLVAQADGAGSFRVWFRARVSLRTKIIKKSLLFIIKN